MEIWLLVAGLLIIAIALLVASFYVKEETNSDVQEELQIRQSEEILLIKERLAEVESLINQSLASFNDGLEQVEEPLVEEVELSEISDLTKEEVIRLYSQGYTMQEIANDVALNIKTVQLIIDDYIENR